MYIEADLSKWTVFNQGFDWKNDWAPSIRYKLNDVVKFGASLWIVNAYHTSQATFTVDSAKWSKFVEGFQYENEWNDAIGYQPGDVVQFGGNSYIAKEDTTGDDEINEYDQHYIYVSDLNGENLTKVTDREINQYQWISEGQELLLQFEEKDENALVSFDSMFDGIRNELVGQIQNSINLADKNIDNEFAKKVLKALFLVKYYGNFKTTKRNISILMIDNIGVDLKKHEQNIDEALNLLENQSYVQRNGDVFEFLTDDGKDVELEIKNTNVDDQAVTTLLKEILFDEIIQSNKIKYLENKQDYEFKSIYY